MEHSRIGTPYVPGPGLPKPDRTDRDGQLFNPYLDRLIQLENQLDHHKTALQSIETLMIAEQEDYVLCNQLAEKRSFYLERIQRTEEEKGYVEYQLDLIQGKEVFV